MGSPFAIGQPTRLSAFHPFGFDKWVVSCNWWRHLRCLQGRGRYGVICRWSKPEHIEGEVLTKWRYINPFHLLNNTVRGCYMCVYIDRSFIIAVFIWSSDLTSVDRRRLVRLWHVGWESWDVTTTPPQCRWRRTNVTGLVWVRR